MNDTVPPDIDGNPSSAPPRPKTHGLLGRLANRHTSPVPVNGSDAATAAANVPDSDNTAANALVADPSSLNNNVPVAASNGAPDALPGTGAGGLHVPGSLDEKTLPRHESGSISTLSAQFGPPSSSQEEKPRADLEPGPRANGKHSKKKLFSKKHRSGDQNNNDGSIHDPHATDDNSSIGGAVAAAGGGGGGDGGKRNKRTFMQELHRSFWLVATHSWMNVLLVFVPVGIIVANVGINARIIFAINCVAIIPLAGLLSFATESVARKMGDALGALLNVTFGNAVELIIFIIALSKDQIRIVQASLLGSILANLLLILGMGFFLGGLRFREQVYNSTVTQMSACLLSLSVISLVLPTAFHASFNNEEKADFMSLKISRGTSVILFLVYIIYLLFQLKSHAYMYESTPQHIVDAEAVPGPAAAWLDSSSSSDDSSSSSSDSDDSSRSRDTMRRRMRKVLRARRRTKSSIASQDGLEKDTRSSSFGTNNTSPQDETYSEASSAKPPFFPRMPSDNAIEDVIDEDGSYRRDKKHRKHRKWRHKARKARAMASGDAQKHDEFGADGHGHNAPRRVDFAVVAPTEEPGTAAEPQSGAEVTDTEGGEGSTAKRPTFQALRGMSVRNLAPTVFVQKPEPNELQPVPSGSVPRVRYGIRRTNSLPDRLHQQQQLRAPGGMLPAQVPLTPFRTGTVPIAGEDDDEDDVHLTRGASVVLLLITTALVAACAEFLVDSIKEVIETTSVKEMFIGLIILPIVGNAAEHVTAVTVAMKNKMDLAIGVAVGSSIQIALFVTPLIVILGWIMDKDMSLYFTLFETVCLFVSAFIVNFLVLDGRSNYLEGALLCAVYLIIAVVAFFFPDKGDASPYGS